MQMDYLYRFYDGWRDLMDNKSDQRTRDWAMMSSPFPTIAVCLAYAYFVKVKKDCAPDIRLSLTSGFFQILGPKLMEDRKPFKLRNVLVIYNFIQVLFSLWLFYEACMSGWMTTYSYRCQPVETTTDPLPMRVKIFKDSLCQFKFN